MESKFNRAVFESRIVSIKSKKEAWELKRKLEDALEIDIRDMVGAGNIDTEFASTLETGVLRLIDVCMYLARQSIK